MEVDAQIPMISLRMSESGDNDKTVEKKWTSEISKNHTLDDMKKYLDNMMETLTLVNDSTNEFLTPIVEKLKEEKSKEKEEGCKRQKFIFLCNGKSVDLQNQIIVHERDAMISPNKAYFHNDMMERESINEFDEDEMHWDNYHNDKEPTNNMRQTFQCDHEPSNYNSPRKNQNSVLRENNQLTNRKSSPYRLDKQKEGNIQYSNAKESHIFSDGLPKLTLTIVSKGKLKGSCLEIGPRGLKGALRNSKDGYTYFGSKSDSQNDKENNLTDAEANDFIIPTKDKENGKSNVKHFYIKFDYDTNEYKIKDLGVGSGVFMKIDFPLYLKDQNMLNMGESFLIVNLIHTARKISSLESDEESEGDENNDHIESFKVESADEHPKIRLKLFGGPRSGDVFYFKPEDCDEIKIGRSPHCNIIIEDEVLSKYQCRIYFDFNTHTWVLEDGSNQKKSLNGTWLYLNEEYSIYENMVFKAHQTLFKANYTE